MGKKKAQSLNVAPTGKTIYVCVKQRGRNEWSCGGRGSRDLLDALRERTGEGSEIEVRACGCLDLCSQGPVVVVAQGSGGKKPPKVKKLLTKKGGAGDVFTHVGEEDFDKLLHRPAGE